MKGIFVLLLILISFVFALGCVSQPGNQEATTTTLIVTPVPEKSCSSDSDCACGTHINTNDCFYGNKDFVNTSRQCPDFCTGIAAMFEIKCVSGECKQVRIIQAGTPQESASVVIQHFAFSPATLTVKAGATVTWTNMDSVPHKIVSTDIPELSSPVLSQGQTYSFTFTNPGSFGYSCSIHPSMSGQVNVGV